MSPYYQPEDKTTFYIVCYNVRCYDVIYVTSISAHVLILSLQIRVGSRTAAISKIECFVIIVNGWKSLTIIIKHSILDVAAALDLPLESGELI